MRAGELPADLYIANGKDPYPVTEEDLQWLYNLFLAEYDLDYKREIMVYFGAPSILDRSPVGYPAEIRKISPQEVWYSTATTSTGLERTWRS